MSALVRRGAWRGGLTYVLTTGATMRTIDTLVTELAQAEQRIAALEAALRALVAREPYYLAQDDEHVVCLYCGEYGREQPAHASDCEWFAAKALVGD